MNTVSQYKLLAGLPITADERAGVVTEAVLHKGDAKKKKAKKANLTEKQMADKKMKKMKFKAVGKIAKGNKKAHEMCETLDKVLTSATKHFGDKKVAKQVTEAILWKKLNDAGVKFQVTEGEMTGYFKQFDGILETVVDTNTGSKSLHGQYDSEVKGNSFKDSGSKVSGMEGSPNIKKDEKWKKHNEHMRDETVKSADDGAKTVKEDASGAKNAAAALDKSAASDKAKEAVKKSAGTYGVKKEGLDLDFFRKAAGLNDVPQDEEGYVVMEGDKIQCIFPNYKDAVEHVEKMKKASGNQGYTIDPRKFARGFHRKSAGDGYSTGSK